MTRRATKDQTLGELEDFKWEKPACESYLAATIFRLRSVPLKKFTIEDLRMAIGQRVGVDYLVPIALEHLEKHPFAEGHFYRGDLLLSVLALPDGFWLAHRHLIARALRSADAALARVRKVDSIEEMEERLIAARERFCAM